MRWFTQQNARAVHNSCCQGGTPPIDPKLEAQAMQHDFALSGDRSHLGDHLTRFQDYCVRADECQQLADRHPALREQYERLAHEWRDLATQAAH